MKKSFIKDILKNLFLSFFSFALPTVVLQFLVQPIIAKELGGEINGQYLTLISFNFFIIGLTASVLNMVRMLQNSKYQEEKLCGDFNIFFVFYIFLLLFILPIGYTYYTKIFNFLDIVLYILVGLLYLYHDYIFAEYRLKLQYKKILINNIILTFGYGISLYIFSFYIKKWQVVFIIPYSLSSIFDYFNTSFIKEPIVKTKLFKETSKKLRLLTCSTMLSSSTLYFDKLILYPLMGGISVSIYNTASLVGKILILVSSPLQSVLLSYLVQENDFKMKKITIKQIIVSIFILIIGYFCCLLVGYPFTYLLYPDWALDSQVFIPITVASSIFVLINNLINTIIIRFFNTLYQVIINSVDLIIYVSVALLLLHFYSLIGFCIGVLIANVIKTIILITILKIKMKQQLYDD